jgi:drug/metabolite transporter (DMT)-like permease
MSSTDQQIETWRVFVIMGIGLSAIGFSPVLVRFATDSSPFLLAAIRTFTAYLILLPFYYWNRTKPSRTKVSRREFWWMAVAGSSLGLHLIAWISSIYYTSIASASVLVTIHPILLILVERSLFKYRFPLTVWVGVLVAFSGSVMLGISDQSAHNLYPNPMLGNGLAALAAIIFAVYFLVGNRIRQEKNWIEYVVPVYGWAAATAIFVLLILLVLYSFGFINDPSSIFVKGMVEVETGAWLSMAKVMTPSVLLVGIGLAIGPQIIGHGSLNYSVKFVSPTLLSTLILFEPVMSSVVAYFLFGEIPLFWSMVGMGVIFLGILLTWYRKDR